MTKYRKLLDAISRGEVEIVRDLLAHRAPADAPWWARILLPNVRPPLVLAASRGGLELSKLLLDAGASPNGSGRWAGGPLAAACSTDVVELVEELILRGADVNRRPSPDVACPLEVAAYRGRANVVELLLRYGADPDLILLRDMTSAIRVRGAIVRMLIDAGGRPSQELERIIESGELWP